MPRRPGLLAVAALLLAVRALAAEAFLDCPDCPALMAVEPGRLRMGSPDDEAGRAADGHEGPVRELHIARRFALGREEVSVGQFRRFVADTGHVTSAERDPAGPSCLGWLAQDHRLAPRPGLQWRDPGYAQGEHHPVVCVSWHDAQAYLRWLSQRSGQAYRLASEAEWEYAARAGSHRSRPWGDDPAQACLYANVADQTAAADGYTWRERHACQDGHFVAAPVGSFRPNAFGLHDMLGNVWEWVQDCYDPAAYARADAALDGRADETPGCAARGLRGGAWISGPDRTRPAYRGGYGPDTRTNVFGFRVARSL
ncbi:formylglycine-generating enzyme family protein [Aquabacterium sp. OR-4]|uniref:formylglycine-generating enzyme family protein n=1 Tax=Aquabacterium sp. OR-4 TaxID=2978127 RepID=UPI0021B390C0|nr:formylglycine-generating enzyme family protein [Aquabacterium sp. OR-4]MDT7836954.1 formylglycine-generating enzyme family protein [Aquabacterium sp. OR-4]